MRVITWVGLVVCVVACGGRTVGPDAGGRWNFSPIRTGEIDKLDLLFAIDNSSSMGDKQDLLAQAVPALVSRLLAPNCVDTTGIQCTNASACSALGAGAFCDLSSNTSGAGQCAIPSAGGACPANTKQEFPPVHDLHIGIVSSSLGGGGSPDVCVPSSADPTHVNDSGHLLNRTRTPNCTSSGCDGPPINNARPVDGSGGNFLAWLPASNPRNANKPQPNVTAYSDGQQAQLTTDFQSLIVGVQEHGCGLEAQLESWYHFLIQPDPYNAIVLGSGSPAPAELQGVDATLLKMRHDFLRPDSVVAIIQVTDEEDSWSDPLWLGGYGWTVRSLNFPGGPGGGAGVGPRGTTECDAPVDPNNPTSTGPNNPDCTSCAFPSSIKPVSGQTIASDPNCQSCAAPATNCPQKGWYTTQQDGLNVRYTNDMKRRYGLDPQWNVQRYIDGLTNPTVPDADHEVHDSTQYAKTQRNCTNPLFAQYLPDGSDTSNTTLCDLQPGSRTPDLVFYAILGGVPNTLVHDANGNFKSNLASADWQSILGKDPSTFQLDGIDPHMIESITPRPGLQAPGGSYTLGTDPINGREYDPLTSVAGIDLQYACTFQLPSPKDCTQAQFVGACDCAGPATATAGGPPLCDPTNRNIQVRGKAYPTIRELRVAKGLGAQSVVASICAADTNPADSALPSYGYNEPMTAVVNRLLPVLGGQLCLPSPLPVTASGTTSCQMLVEDPSHTDQATACTDPGLSQPSMDVWSSLQKQWQATNGTAPLPVVCALNQLVSGTDYSPPSCESAASVGWCYVQSAAGCAQSVHLSNAASSNLVGKVLVLACPVQ